MTDHQSRIQPELMKGLRLLKYSIKHRHSISFTVRCSWQDEEELRWLMTMDGDAPENLKAFQESLFCTKDKAGEGVASNWFLSHMHWAYNIYCILLHRCILLPDFSCNSSKRKVVTEISSKGGGVEQSAGHFWCDLFLVLGCLLEPQCFSGLGK